MFSIKDTLRKTIITTSALAVFATSFFTGCSQQPTVSDVDLYPPSPTAEVSTPYTEELTDDINPDINNETHDTEAALNSVTYAIYVNNIETGMTTTPDGMIEVSSVLPSYGVANYAPDEQALYLHTAAVSNLKLEFKTEADTITIEYSTGEKDENISTKEIILAGDMLKMSPEAVEHYLGYDIEVYDDFINIVTDNKDIIKPENVVSSEAKADPTLDNNDTAKPADDPANVDAKEELIKDQEQAEKEAEDKAIEEITGKPVDEMTQEDYDTFGITPPGENPDTYKPSTDSDGKTVAQRRDEAINKANENIKNGTCGWDEEDIEASKDYMRQWLQEQGYSQEEIEALMSKD